MSKRIAVLGLSLVFLLAPITNLMVNRISALSGSEFQTGRIIDDVKFFTNNSPMSVSDIQKFLGAKVPVCDTWGTQMHSSGQTRAQYSASQGVSTPFICLKDYQTAIPSKSAETGLCNGITASGATAAEIIAWVSDSCGINPQVMIVLLQKEQSLITDDWPWPVQYRSATGYGCPDTAPCDEQYYGFFNQVYNAARQFKRYVKDSHLFNFRAGMNANVQYNPNAACGSSTVFLENHATAGLYNYTPYQPNQAALNNLYGTGDSCSAYGNRNFWRIFNDWFGTTFGPPDYSCKFANNVAGAPSGQHIIPVRHARGAADKLRLVLPNNTGSSCIEVHTWLNSSYQQWIEHTATNWPAINPLYNKLLTADRNGDGTDELYMVNYAGTGSGMIEVHGWDTTNQHWVSHIATNRPSAGIDATNAEVIAADTNGDGVDEFYLAQYVNNGSGRLEVHGWSSNFQQWVSHIATNYGAIDPKEAQIIAADTNGDGVDEFYLINYSSTGSGMVEVHGWSSNFQQWVSHIATNRSAITHLNITNVVVSDVISADTNGDARDELLLIEYSGTGSGMVEVHGWSSNFQQWVSHIATSHVAF